MDIVESFMMATKTLTTNKLRSSLTMLGIIIGNASVIAMIGIGQGAQSYMLGKLESFGANRLVVFPSSQDTQGLTVQEPTLVLSDAEAIKTQVPAVTQVAPIISSKLLIAHGSRQMSTNVFGTTPDMTSVMNILVTNGRFFDLSQQQQNAQVAALGPEAARKLFGSDNPIGQEVLINNLSFQVIGMMQAKGSLGGDNPDELVYVPITAMASQISGRKSPYGIPVDYIQVSAQDKSSIRAAAFQMSNVLTRLHGKKDFTVVANKSFQDLIGQVTGAMSLMLAAIAGISLLVGGIGIMNIMLVSVTERTKEIGLRKAIGATQQAILTQFIIEAVILSVAGGLVGTSVGVSGAMFVAVFTPLKPTVPLSVIAISVGVSGSIGLIFGIVPARRAAQLDPIVALRSA
ncbi:ABC transporter permease [Nostoc sp. 'Peltigera membranacea cyanobiont' 232]|uniref:ABC transporter permease n=1 Tax=Nostoc sp. 'Peltigera membranacea cyanobiont' 232 TaxID=2014531 RepID=UPI000B95519B|nr:ABC transporter permease [Nostoc sp. 'Peltigera membranacea cyanobiont' 232]OYE04345.1 ABC transporter permease [Nostoc sp. 'Peltigera membranacea cyanobiont' 232]